MSQKSFKYCPKCGKKQDYHSEKAMKRAKRNNTSCKSCANKGNKNPNYKKVKVEDLGHFKYCPECNEIQTYSSREVLNNALEKSTLCHKCSSKGKRNNNYKENKEYERDCPECGKTLTYAYSSGFSYAKKINSLCNKCASQGKGKKDYLHRHCPDCGKKLYYSNKQTLSKANEESKKCRECLSSDFPSPMKHLNYEFSEDHKEKLRQKSGRSYRERFGAEKAKKVKKKVIEGLTNMEYEKYMEKLSEKEKYTKRARYMSRKRNLSQLKHYNKSSYELDHIYPIVKGFYNDVPLEVISSIQNLQFLKQVENRKKNDSIPKSIPKIVEKEL
jgi:hypothetical protein